MATSKQYILVVKTMLHCSARLKFDRCGASHVFKILQYNVESLATSSSMGMVFLLCVAKRYTTNQCRLKGDFLIRDFHKAGSQYVCARRVLFSEIRGMH